MASLTLQLRYSPPSVGLEIFLDLLGERVFRRLLALAHYGVDRPLEYVNHNAFRLSVARNSSHVIVSGFMVFSFVLRQAEGRAPPLPSKKQTLAKLRKAFLWLNNLNISPP